MLKDRLKHLREHRDINQKQVAQYINRTTQAYSHYEKGERQPDIQTLIKLADLFSVSLDYLVGRPYSSGTKERFTVDEIEHIKNYRALSERGRRIVDGIIDVIKDQTNHSQKKQAKIYK